jgi:hypothetical protein
MHMSASALRYRPRSDRNVRLRQQIVALAQRHRRYGAEMIYLKLRQSGQLINHKRVERLYALEKLQVRRRRPRSCIAEVLSQTHGGKHRFRESGRDGSSRTWNVPEPHPQVSADKTGGKPSLDEPLHTAAAPSESQNNNRRSTSSHQFRIDRWPAGVAVKRGEVGAQIGEVEKLIDAAKQMIGRNVVFKIKRVEQAVLVTAVVSHHLNNLPDLSGKSDLECHC